MKCKCGAELKKGIDYVGKGLCKKCYYHQYITSRWKKDKKYRKEQRYRIDKWQKDNRERVKEIARKCYKNKQK